MLRLLLFVFAPLIMQLGSPDWSERERADRILRNAGLWAVPSLYLATNHTDTEIAQRAERILARYECQRDDIAAVLFVFQDRPGWICPEDCGWWVQFDRRFALDRLAKKIKAYPDNCGSCWYCDYLSERDKIAAVANYLRSRATGRPIPWSWSWESCVRPK